MPTINWSSLNETTNEDTHQGTMEDFVSGTTFDVQYLTSTAPTLTEEEVELFEKLNKKTNTIRKQAYHTTVLDLSVNTILTEWAETIIYLIKDLMEMIYTHNISFENIHLLLNTGNRLFFIGLTCVLISFFIYLGNI